MSRVGKVLEEYRDQPDEELRQALAQTRDDLFRLHLGQHTNQVTSTAALVTKRRDIARILTVMRGRALGFETQAQKKSEKTEAAPAAEETPKKKTRKSKKDE
jgi:large subunit ribosomal protein L29